MKIGQLLLVRIAFGWEHPVVVDEFADTEEWELGQGRREALEVVLVDDQPRELLELSNCRCELF